MNNEKIDIQQSEMRKRARNFLLDREKIKPEPDRIIVEVDRESLIEDQTGQPQRYQAEVALRQFFADITVRIDAETGELLSWIIPERYKGATETTIDLEQSLRLASELVEIPDDAEIEEMTQETQPDSHITNIIWRHVVNGLEVEGDCIIVQINSKTKEFISMAKVWNTVSDYKDKISSEDAVEIVRKEAPKHVMQENFEITAVEQKFIPVVVDEDAQQKRARIVKVWSVIIVEPHKRFPRITTLSVDCMTGAVVRVEYSK